MFNKRVASEDSRIVSSEEGVVSRIFNKIGKTEATELEIRRAARAIGVEVPNLLNHCEAGTEGRFRLRPWS